MARLIVLKPGFYSSIQDLGRLNHRNIGVPHSGSMDQIAAQKANSFLGNNHHCAVMEMTLKGGEFQFSGATYITFAGGNARILLNEQEQNMQTVISIQPNDIITVEAVTKGNFIYMAIKHGFQTAEILDSRSFYSGITEIVKLKKQDQIEYRKTNQRMYSERSVSKSAIARSLQCFPGAEYDELTQQQQEKLLLTKFHVSNKWSRMAFQLDEKLPNDLNQLQSSPVLPGTVQLTPDGTLIILMRDAQTTGGYPRILQLTENAISLLSQTAVGEELGFVLDY